MKYASNTGLIIGVAVILIIIAGLWFKSYRSNVNAQKNSLANNDAVELKQPASGEGVFVADTAKSLLRWEGRKTLILNYKDTGVIKLQSGQIKIENGRVSGGEFTMDMTSIATEKTSIGADEDLLTRHLKSPDFFDAEKFSTSRLVLTAVTKDVADASGNKYRISGELTIKGITQPIVFPAEIYRSGSALKALARLELDRTKWEVRFGSGKFFQNLGNSLIDDNFTVELSLLMEPVKAQ